LGFSHRKIASAIMKETQRRQGVYRQLLAKPATAIAILSLLTFFLIVEKESKKCLLFKPDEACAKRVFFRLPFF